MVKIVYFLQTMRIFNVNVMHLNQIILMTNLLNKLLVILVVLVGYLIIILCIFN